VVRCSPITCPGDPAPEPDTGPDADLPDADAGTDDADPDALEVPGVDTGAGPPGPDPFALQACGCLARVGATAEELAFAAGVCGPWLEAATVQGESTQFESTGSFWGIRPRAGECLAVLSTGRADQAPEAGSAFDPRGAQPGTEFRDGAIFANPRPAGGPAVYDLATLELRLTPPPGARGLEFEFMFLSAEWPEYLCQQFNDTFLALLTSAANPRPAEAVNVSFDAAGNEVSVNIGFFENPADWSVDLGATPFGVRPPPPVINLPLPGLQPDACPAQAFRGGCSLPSYCDDGSNLNYVGSGSGWLRSAAPVQEGESEVVLRFTIHDEGDAAYDSTVLISGFRWLPFTPSVETVKI
jgi:hypothetical protein